MPDNQQTTQGTSATPATAGAVTAATQTATAGMAAAGATAATTKAAVTSSDGVVVDKNKSQEQYIKDAEAKYIIPALVREKFPDLIKLIYETESMNEEEREYWLQIMPIMSEDQIVKFRDILVNEKQQLSKLDTEYQDEMKRINNKTPAEIDEVKMKEKLQEIRSAEKTSKEGEKSEEDKLLEQLKNV